jgi:Purple acid Phosphatase, N-terminal domain/Calcineurin-like phosphoesterase
MRHFSVQRPKKADYESIPEEEEDAETNKPHQYAYCGTALKCSLVYLVLVSVILGLTLLLLDTSGSSRGHYMDEREKPQQPHHHHESIPTALSIVDPTTAGYIYALDNPVYQDLEHATIHDRTSSREYLKHERNVVEYPAIFLDVNHEHEVENGRNSVERTSLDVTWLTGKDTSGRSIVKGDDLLVLRCGDNPHDLHQIVEAAALNQVQATHEKHAASRRQGRRLYWNNKWKYDWNKWNTDAADTQQNNNNWFSNWHEKHYDWNNKWHIISKGGHDTTDDETNEWYIPNVPSAILRQPFCQFLLYVKEKPGEYYIAAESAILQFGEVDKPAGIHLALTELVDRMTVQFVTGAMGTPVAHYGTDPRKLVKVAAGTVKSTDTYTAADMCQAPANETGPGKFQSPGYLHTLQLTDLLANTVYYYKVGLETGQGVTWSSPFSFTTALAAGDPTEHTYLVYGDQGCPKAGWDEGSAWVTVMATRELPHIRSIHHVGDLSYALGAAHQWDAWFDMIQPVAAHVPLMIAVGNHEYDHKSGGNGSKDPSRIDTDSGFMPAWGNFGNDSGGECGVPISKRFSMPASGNGVFWYSYDCGLVHTVVLSSEHDLSSGAPQREWLEKDLRNTDRAVTPWLIVEAHRPFYEGEKIWSENSVGISMRLEMEDLLYDYDVDVVIAGHYHAYHRT